MGASCVGRGPKSQAKRSDNKSNTLSSEMNSHEEIIIPKSKSIIQEIFPTLILLSYKPKLYQIPSTYKINTAKLKIHRQFRYQQLLDFHKKAFSQQCLPKLDEIKQKISEQATFSQCSHLERQYWQQQNEAVVIKGKTYIIWQNKSKKYQNFPPKQRQNGDFILNESISIIAQDKQEYYIPNKVLIVNMVIGQNQANLAQQKCYQINNKREIQIILKEIQHTHRQFEYFYSPFISGIVFTEKKEGLPPSRHYLSNFFMLQKPLTPSTIIIMYQNKPIPKRKLTQNVRLQTYFQIAHWTNQFYGHFWNINLTQLEKRTNKQKINAYLSIQFLRCLMDNLDQSYMKSNKNITHRQQLSQLRIRLISHFLSLQKNLVKSVYFISTIFFLLQGYQKTIVKQKIKQMINSMTMQINLIADGLFVEFGFQINQKQHPFKSQSVYFNKINKIEKPIKYLSKTVLTASSFIINKIKTVMHSICQTESICQATVLSHHQNFMKQLQIYERSSLKTKINTINICDYMVRIKLLQYYIEIINGNIRQSQWKAIQKEISEMEYISIESMLFFFTVGALTSTSLKISSERTTTQQLYYIKALEASHKLFGDPRANRSNTYFQKGQIWEVLILQNYCSLYKGNNQKKQYYYLSNILQCLKEDIKDKFPLFNFPNSVQQIQQQAARNNLSKMIEYLPIRNISGYFMKRSQIWDQQREENRSNYSESVTSTNSKKNTKTSNVLNESQFSIKLSKYVGIIRWGQNIAGPPHILPHLKNKQVISIASGNYHSVFVTEQGIFGWGQNYSHQLGSHNQEKIYIKQSVMIKEMKICRDKDRVQISCGNQHTAVLINGKLFMWGQSSGGILAGDGLLFDYVSCGGLHTLAIRQGLVYSWGRGEGGQLGHPLSALNLKKKDETTEYYIDAPTQLKSIPTLAVKVVCGDAHSLVLTVEGKVYVFGFCYQGQLGLGLTGENEIFQIFQPQDQNFFKQKVIDIFAGPTFSFFKTEKQEVYSCGMNDCLQLGIDRVMKVFQKKKYLQRTVELNRKKLGEQQFSRPRKIDMFNSQLSLNLIHLQCGQNHCLAMVKYTNQKMIMGWGLNKNYQIDSQMSETTTPRTLDSIFCQSISQICCGSTFSLAKVGHLAMTRQQLKQSTLQIYKNAQSEWKY